ncbi:putative tripeptidyl-peptidase 1 precursor protein [Rutstroemia sp. NJR-2017a WRK4]|nr:putative tripeptidyl-peptidase 1 precursor protein [Rutstroemia sp. NJR-2017a WRK4]
MILLAVDLVVATAFWDLLVSQYLGLALFLGRAGMLRQVGWDPVTGCRTPNFEKLLKFALSY